MSGGLLWVTTALSTLRPATSPRISRVRLEFVHSSEPDSAIQAFEQEWEDDIPRVEVEVTRIRREFEGAVVGVFMVQNAQPVDFFL